MKENHHRLIYSKIRILCDTIKEILKKNIQCLPVFKNIKNNGISY